MLLTQWVTTGQYLKWVTAVVPLPILYMYLTFICAKTVENIIISFHYGPNNILISMVRRIISIIDFDDQGHS